jgi:accessory gene regulator B
LSRKLAGYVVKNDETADYEVIQYGFELLLQEYITLIAALALSIPFGLFLSVLLAILVFSPCRVIMGGAHAQTRLICISTYFVLIYGSCIGARFITLPLFAYIALYIVCIILAIAYVPADTQEMPYIGDKTKRKLFACACLTVYYAIALLIRGRFPSYAVIIALLTTIVAVFTHPIIYRLYGCEKSSEAL